jgi:hypothetical protein
MDAPRPEPAPILGFALFVAFVLMICLYALLHGLD